ncbi:MAG: class I SAM-dependent methyltransferase [Alphaproteobacteria bacterium]|nr:class I SAM-dependent methyltransferase [Alphaproteobacteria bacterium]MBV9964701.1 class I SAM-dependent methyltransferase [Alphaproteobacteria bacterium]
MDPAEYEKLDRLEDRMWWFGAMHCNLLTLARHFGPSPTGSRMLDAGCGTGGLLARLAADPTAAMVIGLDADETACGRASTKSARPVCRGSVNALPFRDAAFATIFSADVLCHRDVDERQALSQFYRCLAPNGILVLNLPAYGWLLSRHDAAVYNIRRYTRRSAARLLRRAGFVMLYTSYWNMLLFPLMVITRKFLPSRGTVSDVRQYPPAIEVLGRAATALERALLRRGLRFPFGGSLIAIAGKPAEIRERDV